MVASWLARPVPAPRPLDTWLGEISYPLFLVHGPVIIGLQFALNAWPVELPFIADLALLLAAPFAAAMVVVALVERPVMAWRRRIRMPETASRPVAPAIATSRAQLE
jgi:peptidoglycan/LPS O-acetylase OafA/YrhL